MMKQLSIINTRFCLAGILTLFWVIPVYAQSPQEYVTRANESFDKGDIVSAMAFYRKAAEAGYVPAQTRLAYLLDQSEENEEAFAWYQKAVEKGDAEAEFGLAGMHVSGDGIPQNTEEALRLFTSSANKDYIPAIHVMIAAYEEGEMGLRIDYETARVWLEKGIRLNDHWSIKRLSRAYSKGELGLRIDRQKAAELDQRLARLQKESE